MSSTRRSTGPLLSAGWASLEDAARFVEHLRNVEDVTDFSVHALTAVPLAVKPWYRVEMPFDAQGSRSLSSRTVAPAVPAPVEQPIAELPIAEQPFADAPFPDAPVAEPAAVEAPAAELPAAAIMPAAVMPAPDAVGRRPGTGRGAGTGASWSR